MRGAGTLEGPGGRGSRQERGGGGRGWRWPCECEAEEEAGSGMDAGVWGRLACGSGLGYVTAQDAGRAGGLSRCSLGPALAGLVLRGAGCLLEGSVCLSRGRSKRPASWPVPYSSASPRSLAAAEVDALRPALGLRHPGPQSRAEPALGPGAAAAALPAEGLGGPGPALRRAGWDPLLR